ncbi:MAG: universal stress protein [Bacteroidales bacterium]
MDTKMNSIILVPTDFSEVCDNAIRHGAEAAKYLNYKLCLLHVVNKNTNAYLKKEHLTTLIIDEKLSICAAGLSKEFGVEVSFIIRDGSIFDTIAEVAHDIGAIFIVMGTHGKIGIQKLTGSYALKVVCSSEIPVIVVQKRPLKNTYNDIVLPITSESGSWKKTQWAAYIAKQFKATIHIFKLKEDLVLNESIKIITRYFDENKVKYIEKTADKGINFTKGVIDYATSINSELIMIMTTSNASTITNFILGTYNEDIIFNTSQIPVMCINPKDVNWEKIVNY